MRRRLSLSQIESALANGDRNKMESQLASGSALAVWSNYSCGAGVIPKQTAQTFPACNTTAARTVVIATGATYRKLALENLSRFEGVGVYYAATHMESQLCGADEVAIVGGGNSAGQAAVFLAQTARRVHLLIRSAGLADSMSRYLIRRIESDRGIVMRTHTEISALEGNGHLERVRWRDTTTGQTEVHDVRHVFSMTGAVPNTGWLEGCLTLDANGFVKTGTALTPEDLAAAGWSSARHPFPLETTLPGVFAVGDVRSGNYKRVAAAVGEGSTAIASVHQVLSS